MKNKKKISVLALVLAIVFMHSAVASAAGEPFYFSLLNTGQNYNYNQGGGGNYKEYAGEAWSMYLNRISFTSSYVGAGMAYRVINSSTGMPSQRLWAAARGTYYGYWQDGGPTGLYYFQGRMDDDLSGSCTSAGWWNADIIYNWG